MAAPQPIPPNAKGISAALGAFLMWGLFPLYFKQLSHINPFEVIAHRAVWTCLLLALIIVVMRRTGRLKMIIEQPKWLALTFLAALLIGSNWLVYVWAVVNDHVLQASLGYFINPLVSVMLSVLFLGERLRKLQIASVILAALAVAMQLIWLGSIPWISLVLATTFGFYGLMQRKTPFDAIDGLFIETLLLLPIGVIWLMQADNAVSNHLDFWLSSDLWLLMLAGPVTLVPLLLYNISTKLNSFALLGFVGYLSPTLVFLLAVLVYKEPFTMQNLWVFALIWLALVIFTIDLIKYSKK